MDGRSITESYLRVFQSELYSLHQERAASLDTDSAVLANCRFAAGRDHSRGIISDVGTNYTIIGDEICVKDVYLERLKKAFCSGEKIK